MVGKHLFIVCLGLYVLGTASASCGCCGGCAGCGRAPSSSYDCGLGPEVDVCASANCQPMVVRPQPLPKPVQITTCPLPAVPAPAPPPVVPSGLLKPLAPVGGPCSCKLVNVRPAMPGRPVCNAKKAAGGAHSCGCSRGCESSLPGLLPINAVAKYPNQPAGPASPVYAPADPVSLSLAYKSAQDYLRGDKELAFGFTKLPKELPKVVKKVVSVPEEQLYTLNGQIVELKPVCNTDPKKSVDEEAIDALLEAENDEIVEECDPIRKVSLGELGYGPAKIVPATFVDVPAPPSRIETPVSVSTDGSAKCNDGFIPGSASFTVGAPTPQYITMPLMPGIMSDPPCSSLEEIEIPSSNYFKSACQHKSSHRSSMFHKYH